MDVADWLRQLGLERYQTAFRENDVGPAVLPSLTTEDLKELGITSVGHRRRLLAAIAALSADGLEANNQSEATPEIAHATSVAERRRLTLIFCDIAGPTTLATRLDPEYLSVVVQLYQSIVRSTISRFGGFIARYVGDDMLIYFGWPEAHETNAESVVRAALVVIAAVNVRTRSMANP